MNTTLSLTDSLGMSVIQLLDNLDSQ